MSSRRFDVLAMGDAIVDVIATCDDGFLLAHGLPKGSMQLLSTEQADKLYNAMGSARETSGGSAANTMAGVAAMGGRAAFVGQVASDQLGAIFAHDMRALGVTFETPALANGHPTGRCLILVTPDAQRTMNTCPGAAHQLAPAALDEAAIRDAAILYLEGYLFGPELPRSAMHRAVGIARKAGNQVAFTLSESVCLPGRKEGLQAMIAEGGIDLIFANEAEVQQLTGRGDLDGAIAEITSQVPTLVVTRGEHGALAVERGERTDVPAIAVQKVVDTTGAGDLFAAGFLTARAMGHGIDRQLMTGAIAAAEVIGHFGARPMSDLKQLVKL
ncbi:adenosine kinase [Sphingomonas sp. BN140010]|uniref:Adenosine kinase n=1 Tax=Sphingomonas arvum TaxID=2992113 RepID=A0ABT3JI55_9SPHN|nr:adenosine kinase [Sphingomonas sp. BN140010]MCW3798767.1 adenosine kinase [Sphingomonas sp. BN140010]